MHSCAGMHAIQCSPCAMNNPHHLTSMPHPPPHPPRTGCILADDMGLGKTLQVGSGDRGAPAAPAAPRLRTALPCSAPRGASCRPTWSPPSPRPHPPLAAGHFAAVDGAELGARDAAGGAPHRAPRHHLLPHLPCGVSKGGGRARPLGGRRLGLGGGRAEAGWRGGGGGASRLKFRLNSSHAAPTARRLPASPLLQQLGRRVQQVAAGPRAHAATLRELPRRGRCLGRPVPVATLPLSGAPAAA